MFLVQDLNEENQLPPSALTSPSTSPITKNDNNLEGVVEVSERPSPVSVLEPLFTEEDVSPASTRLQPGRNSYKILVTKYLFGTSISNDV